MKLYLAPGACSLSPHIALEEAGLSYETEAVNLKTKETATGLDYRTINPKGSVPALKLDDGQVLTEGPAIVQYIADRKPEAKLAPAAGSMERYRLQEWLNFISTELHKNFSPLFNPKAGDDWKQAARDLLTAKFTYVAGQLKDKSYLMGEGFSIADGYLFTILRWAVAMKFDLNQWPVLPAYMERVKARPHVQAVLKAEGLTV